MRENTAAGQVALDGAQDDTAAGSGPRHTPHRLVLEAILSRSHRTGCWVGAGPACLALAALGYRLRCTLDGPAVVARCWVHEQTCVVVSLASALLSWMRLQGREKRREAGLRCWREWLAGSSLCLYVPVLPSTWCREKNSRILLAARIGAALANQLLTSHSIRTACASRSMLAWVSCLHGAGPAAILQVLVL